MMKLELMCDDAVNGGERCLPCLNDRSQVSRKAQNPNPSRFWSSRTAGATPYLEKKATSLFEQIIHGKGYKNTVLEGQNVAF